MMMGRDIDIMPRPFAVTLMVGVMVGTTFWGTLIALVAR
jgi:hypothetical protein